jgi:hypothetical protein
MSDISDYSAEEYPLTVLTGVCAGDAHMLLDKYAHKGIVPNFFPFVVKSADLYALYPYNYSTSPAQLN